jgi:hypothetical protein
MIRGYIYAIYSHKVLMNREEYEVEDEDKDEDDDEDEDEGTWNRYRTTFTAMRAHLRTGIVMLL